MTVDPTSYGYSAPGGDDLLRHGDDAITNNARKAVEQYLDILERLKVGPYRGPFPNGTNLNTLTNLESNGVWRVSSQAHANTLLNYPGGNLAGNVLIMTTGAVAAQFVIPYAYQLTRPSVLVRTVSNIAGPVWTDWVDIAAPPLPALAQEPYRHADLVSRAAMRRGGRIGTGGLGAVALRFDHHLIPFRTKVLPLLRTHRLPWAQIVNPGKIGIDNDAITWAQLQTDALDGGEIWNHGMTHLNPPASGIHSEIVDSLTMLRTNLPQLAIEGWAPPGSAGGGDYGGAIDWRTTDQLAGSAGGRLILDHHALVAGYAPGVYRTLDPTIQPIGAPHITIDTMTAAQVLDVLDTVEAQRVGVALMLHANYLDEPGYMSLADLTEIFLAIRARREAQRLMTLSYSGLWFADVASSHRDDLAKGQWALPMSLPTGTTTLTLSASRSAHRLGSIRELRAAFTGGSGTISIKVAGGRTIGLSQPSYWAIPSSTFPVTIPATGNLSVVITTSAPTTLTNLQLLAL